MVEYVLRLADDALVTAQRLGEWYAAAHDMEEDVALANIALDQLGTARLLLTYAGELEGAGRDEDALAFLRDEREYRNCVLVELPNGDFGHTMARLLFLSAYQRLLYDWTVGVSDERLAAIAGKARKESAYHLDHSAMWTVRLGDGTDESHRRMQAAVDALWPYTHELFAADDLAQRLDEEGRAVNPATLRDAWLAAVEPVLAEATLTRPADAGSAPGGAGSAEAAGLASSLLAPGGGRRGEHTEHLRDLLAEMQSLHRAFPGAQW
jgi:ring-1,2-phenylacetyl-CoA epoxidase subunit PaaC